MLSGTFGYLLPAFNQIWAPYHPSEVGVGLVAYFTQTSLKNSFPYQKPLIK
jgi:hypothetical protein